MQQAAAFSDKKRSAIIIGDSAATASFFQGQGANTAFEAVEIAGMFFKEYQERGEAAYEAFDARMKNRTDELIKDSWFLFFPEQVLMAL